MNWSIIVHCPSKNHCSYPSNNLYKIKLNITGGEKSIQLGQLPHSCQGNIYKAIMIYKT